MLDRKPPEGFRERLVDLVVELRPDWPRPHVVAAFENAEKREPIVTLGQFAAAAINMALERSCRIPKAFAYNGPHWPSGKSVGITNDRGPVCRVCGRSEVTCRAAEARVDESARHEYRETP